MDYEASFVDDPVRLRLFDEDGDEKTSSDDRYRYHVTFLGHHLEMEISDV